MLTEYEKNVVKAVISYYNHEHEVFLNYVDEAVIWYGPREGEYIVGKSNLEAALKKVNKNVKFKVEDITTKLFTFSASIYCVIVNLRLLMFRPDGSVREYLQRITFNGRRCKDPDGKSFWLCPYIEVSNIIPKKDKGGNSTAVRKVEVEENGEAVFFRGENHTTLVLNCGEIKYIEGGKGVYSFIYTDGDVFKVHHLLKDIMNMLPSGFYRCHSSYIVNIKRVSCMSASGLTLSDGTLVPIPVKKAKQITEDIKRLMML